MTRRAFTLIEMTLVLVVLGITSLMAVPALMRTAPAHSGARERLLRSAAIRTGLATCAKDVDAERFPVYVTPDGFVIADSLVSSFSSTRQDVP